MKLFDYNVCREGLCGASFGIIKAETKEKVKEMLMKHYGEDCEIIDISEINIERLEKGEPYDIGCYYE